MARTKIATGNGTPEHPWYDLKVELVGQNGNIFNLMAVVKQAMEQHNVAPNEIKAFINQVKTSQDYDQALCCIMRWVKVS